MIEPQRGAPAPDAAVLPRLRAGIDRREQRADDADAAAAHDVDLDAGLVQRAQHARVVCAARAVAAQENGGSQLR